MIDLHTATIKASRLRAATYKGSDESRQFATAILSADGDEIAFMDGHGITVLTVRRELIEDGETSVLVAEASGDRYVRKNGFEVLL